MGVFLEAAFEIQMSRDRYTECRGPTIKAEEQLEETTGVRSGATATDAAKKARVQCEGLKAANGRGMRR